MVRHAGTSKSYVRVIRQSCMSKRCDISTFSDKLMTNTSWALASSCDTLSYTHCRKAKTSISTTSTTSVDEKSLVSDQSYSTESP